MRFRILGSLEAESEHGRRLSLGGPCEQRLLAALLLSANRTVPVSRLMDTLWDDPPITAAKQVRNAVSRLRKELAGNGMPEVIVTEGAGYRLVLPDDAIDARQFEALMRQATAAASRDQAAQLIVSALGLWRGPALSGLTGQVLEAAATGFEERRNAAREMYYEHMLALGRHQEIVPELSAMAADHPLRERLAGQLMLALYRSGRQADALEAYQRTRAALAEELGLDPGPDLRQLHQQVLRADPSLATPPAAVDAPGPATAGTSERDTPAPGDAAGGRAQRSAALPSVIPRQLPAVPRHFTGRSAEILELNELLDESLPGTVHDAVLITAIGGTAGIGKTALAVCWAHQAAERFPDGQLYVNLCGYGPDLPVPAADALAGFLRALGVPGQDIPAGEAERAAQYRSMLATRRMLVVLDNAGSAEQVRPLLPGTPSCAVVVTSRDALAGLVARDGARRLDLDVLPPDDAAALLRALIGYRAHADPAAVADLAGQCSRLPLALRVAAELAAARPATPLAELTRELADQQRRLDLLEAGGDSRTAVRAVFSWSCRHLDTATARGFRLLSLHPGPDFDRYAAAALTGASMYRAEQILEVLARAHLIQQTGPGRFGMHDLLRAYARELAAAHEGEEQQAALTRLLDLYLHATAVAIKTAFTDGRDIGPAIPAPAGPAPRLTDPAAARDWLDGERATLVAVAAHAAGNGWPGHATRLAAALKPYLENGDHYPEAIIIHGHARRAARQMGDRAAEAAALIGLGRIDWVQGRCPQASRRFQEALGHYQEAGDLTGQAGAANNLGLVDLQQGRYRQAADHFREALGFYRAAGHRLGQARALGNLGVIDRLQGRYRQAVDCQQQALAIFREFGDEVGEVTALTRLGVAALWMGRHQDAAEHLQQAVTSSRAVGDRNSQAAALAKLGDVALRMGRCQQATEYQTEAMAVFRDIGDANGETMTLNGLGEALLAAGQPGEARTRHAAALNLAAQTGDTHQQARAHDGLGRACHALGDAEQAHDHWRQALALYTALGAPEADQVRAQLTRTPRQAPAMQGMTQR